MTKLCINAQFDTREVLFSIMHVELFSISAPEMYCLYSECTNLAKSGHGYFGDRVDLNVWKSKDEIHDVLLNKLMYNDRRHNILGKKPASGNVDYNRF